MRQIAPCTMKCFLLRCTTSWFTVRETVCEDQREYCSIHTHRNLGIPNRAIQSKFLPRHVGVTKHIRIGVTGRHPTTWHRKVEHFFLTIVLNRQRTQSIFFCMSNTNLSFIVPLIIRQSYRRSQMRNRVWPNTESTTCCPKTFLRNLHGVKTVSYLNNKNVR